jgi:sugar phosphate isomerase/epimerase
MRYGAMNFPVRPVLGEIHSVAELNFDYLELAMDPPEAHHITLRQNWDPLRAALDNAGLGLVCHLPTFLSMADLSPALREASVKETLSSLETAADFRAAKVCVHPGYVTGLGAHVLEKCRSLAMESLEQVVAKARSLGLELCLENMLPRTKLLTRPEEFDPVFAQFPDLKMTLDVGHAFIAGGQKLVNGFIERFGDRIGHVHLNDNHGRDDAHLPLGVGAIDFNQVVRGLKAAGYAGTFTFEIFARERMFLAFSRDRFRTLWEDDGRTDV